MKPKFTFYLFTFLFFALTLPGYVSGQTCTPGAPVVFTNSTPVAIPTGPGVVTSTLNVAGAPIYLYDLNITTFIAHTFAADLDITIQSPAGTIVTLTSDNGAGNDDVFNGTVWDDNANPAGQVPYTTNNGLATDHSYVNLTLASPLVPEEALGAFIGENPNGTWTITISDDLAGDGGSLNSWSLSIRGLSAPPVTTAFAFNNSTPVAIPTGPAVVTSTLNVAGAGTQLLDVNLTTFITHTFNADLDITIQSPAGTIVTLTSDNAAGNDDVFNGTVWDDDANPAGQVPYTTNNGVVSDHAFVNLTLASPEVPEEAMAAFVGENPNGTWTITISDDLAGDGGSLNSWTLNLVTSTCPPPLAPCAPAAPSVFTNSTPVAIPTGPAVVSSTLNVAGAPTYLYDLNITTFITHTFAADLDITIQSPAGTVVTLTSDNGAGNDDVFNGTVWDDDANPAGQVPYTTNNGMVTDHAYVNLTLASPLVPEEALGAFIGENPNGTWTITISDDLAGDGGSLNSWSLAIAGLPAAPVTANTSVANVTPVAIPTGPAVVSSTVNVAGAGTQLLDVNLTTFITHTFAADLDITLQSPAGTVVTLTTDNGAGNDNVFNGTVWDDDANPAGQVPYTTNNGMATDNAYVNLTLASPLAPEEALAAFIGENPNGTWTITISDDLTGDGGSLDSWSLDLVTSLCGAPSCTLTCPANITVGNAPNQCGAVVNYPAPTTSGTCGTVTASPASGSFFPVGVTTVNVSSSVGGGTCSFTIRVNDVQPPTITCPANIVVGNTTGQCGAVVNFSPTVTDNCPGVTVSSVPASGSFFPVGTTTVTSTATDGAGNTATCSFTVRVNDTEPPIFSSPGLFPERLYYKFDGAGATVPNLATAPPPGTATATLTGLTQGGSGKCGGALIGTGTANQSMNTNWATNMTGPWTISFWLGPNQVDNNPSYLFGDVTATGGATGAFRCFYGGAALGNNVLLRGGSADVLISGVNPGATLITIVYNGVNTVVYKNGASPQTYAVTFNSVGTGPFRVGGYSTLASVNGRLDEFSMYTRALTPVEVLSIFNTCPANINNCPSNITVNNAPGVCNAVVTYTTPVALDNCPGVTTTQIAGLPSGSTFPVGTTVNTFRATDAAGNITLCTFNVTVVDAEQPTITCPANQVINTDLNQCYATFTPPQPTFADNCAVTRLTWVMTGATTGSNSGAGINYVPSTQFQLNGTTGFGITTITYTAYDAAGNTRTCAFTVRVNDFQIPVITAQPATKFVCVGSPGAFPVVATANGGPIAYQWQEWNGSAWVNIAGATAATFTIPAVSFTDNTRTFRCILTGRCTVVISSIASLYVNPLPTVTVLTSIPPSLTPGQSLNITSTVSPGGGSYAWYKNNVLISGATGSSLTGLTVDDIGTYKLTYTDPNGCVSSSADVVVSGQPFDKLWIYPNPNDGNFQVRFYNQPGESATVNVYDSKGARVYQNGFVTTTAYTKLEVNLGPTMADGTYVVELVNSSGKRVGTKKIIVRRK